jgi:FMN-dependent oxidoreductase (nitrilotriacetate monooxygenase family)
MSYTHLDGRWRAPGSWVHRTFPDVAMFEELARIAERGCFDMMFFGDGTGIPATWEGSEDAAVRWGIGWPRQDMSPYISVLAKATRHLGFGLTYASTFMHPFYVARLLNSLDHITGGRIAFNVITSTRQADAANYGFDELMEHGERYERMEEFVDVCKALWASVGPDAFIWDRDSGIVANPDKVRPINHAGRFFKVRGPLNTVPSPQGRPVLIQAGGSPRGIKASAHFADHVFATGLSLAQKRKHREALDTALIAEGRDPSEVGILFNVTPMVAESEKDALALRERMLDMIPQEAVGAYLSYNIGYDFSTLPERFSPHALAEEIAARQNSPISLVSRFADQLGPGATISREDFFREGVKVATGYERVVAGTPAQVADFLEEHFDGSGSRGGFMISHPHVSPRDLMSIVDLLIPELQRRGRFRRRYTGRTLREVLAE